CARRGRAANTLDANQVGFREAAHFVADRFIAELGAGGTSSAHPRSGAAGQGRTYALGSGTLCVRLPRAARLGSGTFRVGLPPVARLGSRTLRVRLPPVARFRSTRSAGLAPAHGTRLELPPVARLGSWTLRVRFPPV